MGTNALMWFVIIIGAGIVIYSVIAVFRLLRRRERISKQNINISRVGNIERFDGRIAFRRVSIEMVEAAVQNLQYNFQLLVSELFDTLQVQKKIPNFESQINSLTHENERLWYFFNDLSDQNRHLTNQVIALMVGFSASIFGIIVMFFTFFLNR